MSHCGILPKKCHVAPSPLDTQTTPLRHMASLIPFGRKIIAHSTRMSHSRNFVRPTSHFLRISHSRNSVRLTFYLLRIFHIRRFPPDGRGGRFNFPRQTCLDPSATLIRRTSVAGDSDSLDSLARQILAIRRIHFRPQ